MDKNVAMTDEEFKAEVVESVKSWVIEIPHDQAVKLVDDFLCDLTWIRKNNFTPEQVSHLLLKLWLS